MAAANAPITMKEALTLTSLGINPQFITFTNVTMESEKYICVRETAPQNSVVIIDMSMPMQPLRRPITADSALMNPNTRILALKAQLPGTTQDHLQIFNIEAKAKIKSHQMPEQVVFWKWITPKMLGLVTQSSVYHWSIEGESEPAKMFDRTANLASNQIINYKCDPSEKWLVLIGIAPGSPERPQLVKGNMQLFSVEQQCSQALEAHAASFATLRIPGNDKDSILISFATKSSNAGQITSKLHVIELGAQPGKPSFTKKQADLFFPPDFQDDFPVAMQISHKYGLIYVITKLGLLFVYDLETAAAVYRNRISPDPIFLTSEASSVGGFYAINRRGQVLLATINDATLVPFVSGQLNNLELAVNLAKRGNLPGAENLVVQRFQELFAQTKYKEAAELAAESPQGILRTPDTVAKFQVRALCDKAKEILMEESNFQILGINNCSSLEINSTSWAHMLEFFERILLSLLGKAKTDIIIRNNMVKATKQCLEILRFLFGLYQAVDLHLENEKLLKMILHVVEHFQGESIHPSYFSDKPRISIGASEVLTIAFSTIGDVYLKVGSSLSINIWQSTIEVLRKAMDLYASRSFLLEDNDNAILYTELLHCLHLVLAEPREYLAEHVAGFVASLKNFFCYGLVNNSRLKNQANNHKEVSPMIQKQTFQSSNGSSSGPYRPPHLRRKVVGNQHHKDGEGVMLKQEFITSDSECSDNDGSVTDNCATPFLEARLGAILCIQDLCRADPKLFTSQWTMLLPSTDVLQHKKYETTLMSCLLYDPSLKVRIAAGSTIIVMLDGPASVSLQVAEFKEPSKCGSFTALSSSLGHILMQLHSGTLYLIKRETNRRLLALTFKILTLLISSTPYSRMSSDLLSMVILSIQSRIEHGFSFQSDQNSLLALAINCLTTALSVPPPSMCVNNMLLDELSSGFLDGHLQSGVLSTLLRHSEQLSNPSISLEAFQALRALAHNYPNVIALCWKQISSAVSGVFCSFSDAHVRSWKGNNENTVSQMKERVMTAAIKVLDECLRAISGFKGTEDLSDNKFFDSPFTSDYVKTKTISSAPSYSLASPTSIECESKSCALESKQWFEAIVKHMPVILKHSSAMVRAASVTCFAGMTSTVFFSLPEDQQEFIISSIIDAALNDEVPSVRSASCRAIGVIACFPQIYQRTEVLEYFIDAAKHNALDSLVSVRVTASWALANICASIGHYLEAFDARRVTNPGKSTEFISSLMDCALRLTRDNDKVKANAVRALGNLARFIQFTDQLAPGDPVDFLHFKIEQNGAKVYKEDIKQSSDSFSSTSSGSFYWLEQMVQAFLSSVTTGNVKVQWNVCHALSNLFLNRSLKLQEMDWATSVFSILLLLLRDSSNFKIRIQAVAALAVPETINDYGKSYYDVVKSVMHVVETFKSDWISDPSNFKYLIALEKQLTSTMLHLLGLASSCEDQAIHDFLIKKGLFLETWIEDLSSSLRATCRDENHVESVDQKKDVILRTILSLIQLLESSNHHVLAERFGRLQSLVKNL